MENANALVLSIHDREGPILAFDLKDLLHLLGQRAAKWHWYVTDLEYVREKIPEPCPTLPGAREAGSWVSAEELSRLAEDIGQTIEGGLIAFPQEIDPRTISPQDLDLAFFPQSRAELALQAVDSSFFEVYTKDPEIASLLHHHFRDVRTEDPNLYFIAPPFKGASTSSPSE